jgi:NAD/NADP transhydrogenase beta subunit
MTAANITALLYLVAGILFILALRLFGRGEAQGR